MNIGVTRSDRLQRWDAKHGLAPDWLRPSRDLSPFHSVATRRREPHNGGRRFASVHLDGTISLRSPATEIRGRTFVAHPGDLVLSKIDVLKGAIGVVPDDLDLVAFSAEYPIYDVRSVGRALPEFIGLVCRTAVFQAKLDALAVGHSGRRRVAPEDLEALLIPVPPLVEQRRLWRYSVREATKARDLRDRAAAVLSGALSGLAEQLGMRKLSVSEREPIFIVSMAKLERWSAQAAARQSLPEEPSDRFQSVPLASLAEVSYGLTVDPSGRAGTNRRPYLRVANVQAGYLDLTSVHEISVAPHLVERFSLKSGDVLVCEGNSPHLVGRPALWNDEIPGCLHQNHVLRIRCGPDISPEYLLAYMNTPYVRAHFLARAKQTTNLATINSTDVKQLSIVVPPRATQRRIAKTYMAAQRAALARRARADEVEAEARTAIDAAIATGTPLSR